MGPRELLIAEATASKNLVAAIVRLDLRTRISNVLFDLALDGAVHRLVVSLNYDFPIITRPTRLQAVPSRSLMTLLRDTPKIQPQRNRILPRITRYPRGLVDTNDRHLDRGAPARRPELDACSWRPI